MLRKSLFYANDESNKGSDQGLSELLRRADEDAKNRENQVNIDEFDDVDDLEEVQNIAKNHLSY